MFESDAKLLVDAVQGRRGLSYFDTIAEDCNELLKHFDEVLEYLFLFIGLRTR